MRFPLLTAAFAALTFALPATAQKVHVFGGTGTRAASTLVMFGDNFAGGMSIVYGTPQWQDEYDGMIDKVKGRLNRLGKDWWTTFTTSVDVEIGGTKIAAGSYLIGLDCSADGKFGLAFLEATKGMKAQAMPFPTGEDGSMNWKPDVVAPLELKKDANEKSVEKLKIELAADKDDPSQGSFTLSWGKHVLTAPMKIAIGG